jgi:hypothetical protein
MVLVLLVLVLVPALVLVAGHQLVLLALLVLKLAAFGTGSTSATPAATSWRYRHCCCLRVLSRAERLPQRSPMPSRASAGIAGTLPLIAVCSFLMHLVGPHANCVCGSLLCRRCRSSLR